MSLPTIRVLVVSNMLPSPEHPARGIFVQSQVDALRRSGEVEVEVAAFDAAGRPWRYATSVVSQALKRYDADLVHAHYGLSGPAALAAAGRRPVVLTVHGRDCHHPVVRRITAAVARKADATVAVSRELAAICPFPTMDVIPMGVDLHRFEPRSRREARQQLGLPENERMILFPSDPARPEKRYDRAQALAQAVPEARLVPLANRPGSEVPLWYNAADAVVIPSEREGYGLACVETLACNVPVLSTPVGIAREVLPGVNGALYAAFDVETWAAHLRTLLQDDDPRVEGRVAVESQSSDVMATRTIALYRDVLHREAFWKEDLPRTEPGEWR
jgi:teichuronic acid biosynthesis glycosyltransferase TuaC